MITNAIAEVSTSMFQVLDAVDVIAFPQWMGVPVSCCVMIGIALAYKGHGLVGLSLLLSYISSLIAVTLTVKAILGTFPYPLFMTTMHFICSWAAAMGAFVYTGEEYPKHDLKCSEFQTWLLRCVVPPSFLVFLSIISNNISLQYIGAGINGMIGLATPVVTATIASIFGLKIAAIAWIGIAMAVAGDAYMGISGFNLAVKDGVSINGYAFGILLGVTAMLARGSKTVLQDKVMNHYGSDGEEQKLSPLGLWFFQGPLLVCFGIPTLMVFEGTAPFLHASALLANPLMLIANIASATGVNIFGMFVIKMLGAPASQIAGKFYVLVVAAMSCAFLGETLTLNQGLAALLIIGGAAVFERAQEHQVEDFKGLLNAFQGEKYDATEKC